MSDVQNGRLSDLIYEATQLALQGWLMSGNISLMEGLRVSHPSGGAQNRPVHKSVPFGSPENDYPFVSVKDAGSAKLFYDEGVRVLLQSMSRARPGPDGKVLVDMRRRSISQFGKLLQLIEEVVERPKQAEAKPRYDVIDIVLAVKSAAEHFHDAWFTRLGLEHSAGWGKEHWTRVKALSRRLATGRAAPSH